MKCFCILFQNCKRTSNLQLRKPRIYHNIFGGWGSKFGTTKCITADISKIRNFEYWNNETWVIRFFYFQINSLFLWLFKLFEHSKYIFIIYHRIRNFWILIVLQIVKLKKFANFWNSTISELWLFFFEFVNNGNWWFSKF